jgi:hypothetical protein
LIASGTDTELANYVEYLKYEDKILRSRLPKQIHTTTDERNTLLKFGKAVGRAINELITIVSPATVARWLRDEATGKMKCKKPKGGQRKPNPLPITSPNLNGRCEKFIGTIKAECLSKFIAFGKRYMDYLVSSFVDYYNHHRAHSGRNHLPPIREVPAEVAPLSVDQVIVRSHVVGLVKSFQRNAARCPIEMEHPRVAD